MRAVLYARVSTQKQADKQLSISAQLRAMRAYASDNAWEIVAEYVDEARSGRTARRPAFQKLLEAVTEDEIDVLLVWKLDRLARNMEISSALDSHLRKNGVRIVSLHEPVDESAQGKLAARMFESFAEFYSNNLSQDIRRGKREVARRGYFPHSRAPVGYVRAPAKDGQAERFKLEPDPQYGPVITRIFQLYASGYTVPQITQSLCDDGETTPSGRKWTKKRLYDILRNAMYCGDIVVGKYYLDPSGKILPGDDPVTIQDCHEPLVPRSVFERVQHILSERSSDASRSWDGASPYLLTGLVYCSLCGAPLVGTSAKSGRYRYYTCRRYYLQGRDACSGVRIPKKALETFVVARLQDTILTEENLSRLTEDVNQRLSKREERMEEELEHLLSQRRSIQTKLRRHYEALEEGTLELSDLAPRIKELRQSEAELTKQERRIQAAMGMQQPSLASLSTILNYVHSLWQTLSKGSLAERKAFLRGVLDRIVLGDGEAAFTYRLPHVPEQRNTGSARPPVLVSVTQSGA